MEKPRRRSVSAQVITLGCEVKRLACAASHHDWRSSEALEADIRSQFSVSYFQKQLLFLWVFLFHNNWWFLQHLSSQTFLISVGAVTVGFIYTCGVWTVLSGSIFPESDGNIIWRVVAESADMLTRPFNRCYQSQTSFKPTYEVF